MLISPRAVRLAAGFVPHIRLGPITIDMFDADILFTSSRSATFLERQTKTKREKERVGNECCCYIY